MNVMVSDITPLPANVAEGTGKVLSANRLADGEVVFLDRQGGWSQRIDDALVAAKADEAGLKLLGDRAVRARFVTALEIIDVERRGDSVRPLHIRERIRALGPTVRPDLGKQAEGFGGRFSAVE
jgi:hypothetical protein